jgi:sugar/nucleoside kinase (ribokinase family)
MAKTVPSILCVGKAAMDVFLRDDEFDPHCEGKVCYAHLPLGAKMDVTELHVASGGNATNVAVTFARQGLDAKYLWALGNDFSSNMSLQALDEDGVDTSSVVQYDGFEASYSTVLVAESTGERTILNYKGSLPTARDVERLLRLTPPTDWVYPTSVGSLDTLEKIIDWAEQHSVKVMLNPSNTELSDPARLKGLLTSVDVLCLNKEEMQQLVEGETLEELVRHGLHYCPVVIVTDGREGACVSDGKTLVTAGLYDKRPSIERTGAGDAFASGFLSQWIKGKSLRECVHFASANSSSVVMKIGAKAGILQKGAALKDMPLKEKIL